MLSLKHIIFNLFFFSISLKFFGSILIFVIFFFSYETLFPVLFYLIYYLNIFHKMIKVFKKFIYKNNSINFFFLRNKIIPCLFYSRVVYIFKNKKY